MSADPVTAPLAALNAAVAAVAADLSQYAADLRTAQANNDSAMLTEAINGITAAATALNQAVAANPAPVPTLVSIAVTPANPTVSMAANPTQQFTAAGTYSDGSTKDLTASASWSSDAPATATVAAGLATLVAPGTANISAASGSVTGSTLLTVTA